MSVNSPAWQRLIAALQQTEVGTIDHTIGDHLATLDDEGARDYLIMLMLEDPPGSRPHEIERIAWPVLTGAVPFPLVAGARS